MFHQHQVGFHRYVLNNLTSHGLDGVIEQEVDEFDAPSEVQIRGQLCTNSA